MKNYSKIYPVINMKATGSNLKRLRKEKNYKVLDICEYMGGITEQAVYKWERGDSIPSTDNLFALSFLYEVSMDDLLVQELQAS